MQKHFVENKNIYASVKLFVVLAFLPPGEISDAFNELIADYPFQLIPVVNYIEETYSERRKKGGKKATGISYCHVQRESQR